MNVILFHKLGPVRRWKRRERGEERRKKLDLFNTGNNFSILILAWDSQKADLSPAVVSVSECKLRAEGDTKLYSARGEGGSMARRPCASPQCVMRTWYELFHPPMHS